ncbi:hypothetical protein [Rubripirellula amarantea]|uniref:hypothetical protein n=1 Tax=Rubripirellula amarantea TaxID=2527999 RepID=UPI0011B60485|nr:hypothetical protein [Rubripirellula amarantea]
MKRPLKEGEWYYSVILESGDDYVRHDYSAESWTEPPEGAIGWWKKRMPKSDDKKVVLAPPAVLVDLLRQMEQSPEKAKSRYLLALMLMRRRVVRPLDTPRSEAAQTDVVADNDADGEGGTEGNATVKPRVLHVEVAADKSTIEIPIVAISRGESVALRDELNELLYCEESSEEDDVDEISASADQ